MFLESCLVQSILSLYGANSRVKQTFSDVQFPLLVLEHIHISQHINRHISFGDVLVAV